MTQKGTDTESEVSRLTSAATRWEALFHAEHFGVVDDDLAQGVVDWDLGADEGQGTLVFVREFNFFVGLECGVGLFRRRAFDGDLHELGARPNFHVATTGGDDLGALARILGGRGHNGTEVGVSDGFLEAGKDATKLGGANMGGQRDLALAAAVFLGDPLEGSSEIAHTVFIIGVAFIGICLFAQSSYCLNRC